MANHDALFRKLEVTDDYLATQDKVICEQIRTCARALKDTLKDPCSDVVAINAALELGQIVLRPDRDLARNMPVIAREVRDLIPDKDPYMVMRVVLLYHALNHATRRHTADREFCDKVNRIRKRFAAMNWMIGRQNAEMFELPVEREIGPRTAEEAQPGTQPRYETFAKDMRLDELLERCHVDARAPLRTDITQRALVDHVDVRAPLRTDITQGALVDYAVFDQSWNVTNTMLRWSQRLLAQHPSQFEHLLERVRSENPKKDIPPETVLHMATLRYMLDWMDRHPQYKKDDQLKKATAKIRQEFGDMNWMVGEESMRFLGFPAHTQRVEAQPARWAERQAKG